MKTPFLFAITFVLATFSYAQIGVGTLTPHPSSILDVQSTSKGFLIPRVTYDNTLLIDNPAEGLMVYCTDCCSSGSTIFFNGDNWKSIISSCSDPNPTPVTPPAINPEDDFDQDLIANIDDLDDDNDGIPDKDEQCGTNKSSFGATNIGSNDNHTFEYTVNNASYLIIDINEIDNAFEVYINGTNILNGSTVTVNGDTQLQKTMDVQGQDSSKKAYKTDMEFIDPSDAQSSQNRISQPWESRATNDLPRVRIIINEFGKVSAFGTAVYQSSNSKYNDGLQPVQLRGYTSNGNPGSIVPFNTINLLEGDNIIRIVSTDESGTEEILGNFTSKEHCTDIDGDGLENQYDLDSDGDGCSDAYEAGATTDITPEFRFPSTNVGTNGIHNSLETSADDGRLNYSIINNFNNATNSNIHTCN
ncbi:MAG: hypothetical protein ACPGSD_00625 [Flavobacteriales bacterium]